MRLISDLLVMFVTHTILAENNNVWWANDNNLCRVPEGSFNKTCTNITLEQCSNPLLDQTPCKLSLDCYIYTDLTRAHAFHNTIYLPRAIKFHNVENDLGMISHPEFAKLLEKQLDTEIACNPPHPCNIPTGNYKDSCHKMSIKHLPQIKACLFRTYCDPAMRRLDTNSFKKNYIHNEVLVSEYTEYTDVKNLHGKIIHPSIDFKPVNDFCYEQGSTENVAENSAYRFGATAFTAAVGFTSLALTLK